MTDTNYIMTVTCTDAVGIVAAVTGFLAEREGFIVESQQYADLATGRFFMRIEFKPAGPRFPSLAILQSDFEPIAARFAIDCQIVDTRRKPRILIAVSKMGHCLNDLLHRWRTGTLPVEIPMVVSNHNDMRALSEWHGIPYRYLPVTSATRDSQEDAIIGLIEDLDIDFIVLARYMQILSPRLCSALAWRCINIHHSFLPSFKGAKPYHQAHARGVKMIGATAHFVTGDLDEGPIIEQSSARVNHGLSADEFVTVGRDVESIVLARAVTWIAERRVLANGSSTVVFAR